jgi:hypothetical protein
MTSQKNSVSAPGLERDRAKSLAQMADQYRKAHTLKKKQQDPCALLNWLTAELALEWQGTEQRPLRDRLSDFQERLTQVRMLPAGRSVAADCEGADPAAAELAGSVGLSDSQFSGTD